MTLAVRKDFRSPNFDARPPNRAIDLVIVHYTGMRTGDGALARLTNPSSNVSAHYVIEECGEVFELISPTDRAWHAGVSWWAGQDGLNSNSIGIELVNPGHEWGYRPFPDAQMAALRDVLGEITTRLLIPAYNVWGHSDVAPLRKEDPGELFDWRWLAEQGFGLWPDPPTTQQELAPADMALVLREIGYGIAGDLSDLEDVLRAFQRHFRPSCLDGMIDRETSSLAMAVRDLRRNAAAHS